MENVRKVRITNPDGNPLHTSVVDAETGEPIGRCFAVDVHFDVNSAPMATIKTWTPVADIVVNADVVDVTPFGAPSHCRQLEQVPPINMTLKYRVLSAIVRMLIRWMGEPADSIQPDIRKE